MGTLITDQPAGTKCQHAIDVESVGALFHETASHMVAAFARRATALYEPALTP